MKIEEYDLFKFTSFDTAKLIVCQKQLKFNNPSFFNDPFDCDLELLTFEYKNVCQAVKDDIERLRIEFQHEHLSETILLAAYKDAQTQKIKKASISCFSLTYSNTVMWAHYGNNHKGVVLIFNNSFEDPFENVPAASISSFPVDYDYNSYKSINYLESKEKAVLRLFAVKGSDWKYEEEYRLVIMKNIDYVKFKPNYLTGVIFGLRIEKKKQLEMIEFCKKHGFANLKFGYMSKNKLLLKINEIK